MWHSSRSTEDEAVEPEMHETKSSKAHRARRSGSRSTITRTLFVILSLVFLVKMVVSAGDFGRLFVLRLWISSAPQVPVRDHSDLRVKGLFSSIRGPHITADFPDPCVIHHDGITYAFGTNNRNIGPDHVHVQVAESTDNSTWMLQPHLDALPSVAPWQSGRAVWAPDVKHLNGRFLLYYTDSLANDPEKHCIGAAISNNITGPYVPHSRPLICPHGGAIDPAGFFDRSTGKRYIVYKIDGNSLGHGGSCGNDVLPIVSTPLMLQEVDSSDGITLIGLPVKILDRDALDGPLIEAPAMYLSAEGIYFLFFSSNCFTTPLYHTAYATATNIKGPYQRASRPLLSTGDGTLGLVGPGGLDILHRIYETSLKENFEEEEDGHMVVFHGQMTHHNMPTHKGGQRLIRDLHRPFVRGMYSATVYFQGRLATLELGGFRRAADHQVAAADGSEAEST